MPGTRYEDWHHLRVEGDQNAARDLIPLARKVLGFAVEQARFNGLQTYKHIHQLEGGGYIIGEVNGGTPRVTIHVPPVTGERKKITVEGDYVVWARTSDTYPDGIDPDEPQQIVQSTAEDGWFTFTAEAGMPGRSDGTYGGSFPEGLRRAGNIDWVNERGERISWYGPSSRGWLDGYVNPRAQYGKFVFMMGLPILDVDQYILDSDPEPPFDDRWVLGAGIGKFEGDTYLYVAHAICSDGLTDMTPIPADEGRITDPDAYNNEPLSFYRYKLSKTPDMTGVYRYAAIPGTRELVGGYGMMPTSAPWFFNQDCTQAVSLRNPGGTTPWLYYYEWPGTTILHQPGTSQPLDRVNFDPGYGWATSYDEDAQSISAGGAPAAAAVEYDREGNLVTLPVGLTAAMVPYMVLGGQNIPLWEVGEDGPDVVGTKRWIVHVNLRDQIVVCISDQIRFDPPELPGASTRGEGMRLEVWLAGTRVLNRQLYEAGSTPSTIVPRWLVDNDEKFQLLAPLPLYPQWFVNGVLVQYQTFTTATNEDFVGANTSYTGFPHAAGDYFGTYDEKAPPARPPTPIGNIARDGFSANRADFDGYHGIAGVAAHKGTAMLSVAIPSADGDGSFHYVIDPSGEATLPWLTGIGGQNERYHPIWIIGVAPESPP